jgi:hypothetical protein
VKRQDVLPSRTLCSVAAIALLLGCGSSTEVAPTGGTGGTHQGGEGGDATTGAAGAAGAGGGIPGHCLSPSGFQACGGDSGCPSELCKLGPGGLACFQPEYPPSGYVSICANDATTESDIFELSCKRAIDGAICFMEWENSMGMLAAPFEVGELLASVGGADQIYYADFSRWTGDPLPEPTTCPPSSGFQLCGPSCAPCPEGEFCHGRAPMHPHGLCLKDVVGEGFHCSTTGHACDPGQKCFIFVVPPDQQEFADHYGYCMEATKCDAAAQDYPGGAKCIPLP